MGRGEDGDVIKRREKKDRMEKGGKIGKNRKKIFNQNLKIK